MKRRRVGLADAVDDLSDDDVLADSRPLLGTLLEHSLRGIFLSYR